MWRGISLANKCLLLFGAAVVLIILAALTVPWIRLNAVVDESQLAVSRQLLAEWERRLVEEGRSVGEVMASGEEAELVDGWVRVLSVEALAERAQTDRLARRAMETFAGGGEGEGEMGGSRGREVHREEWAGTERRYRLMVPVRSVQGDLVGIVAMTRQTDAVATQLLLNTTYLLSAGAMALGLAVLVFYLITTRLILSPVRSLRETAELVREGDLRTRADIHTGDEFEELAQTFNQMLEALSGSQEQLRTINTSLDLKLSELAERNVALFESNKLKGEFLANVSHELRTPLNSIIGFGELLLEIAKKEQQAGDDSSRLAKRVRFLENILTSAHSLLGLINGLLEMAKIEAGRVNLDVSLINVADACEALAALIRPLADRAEVDLEVKLDRDLPMVQTDARKFQQIMFNLLSNAVKFTSQWHAEQRTKALRSGEAWAGGGGNGKVTLRADVLPASASDGPGAEPRVRLSVLDNGPGIAAQDVPRIFEKFHQLDASYTRKSEGAGLGLAICKELASVLRGEIEVDSEVGRGSMFSLILPVELDPATLSEMQLEQGFRGQLAEQSRGAGESAARSSSADQGQA